MFKKAGLVLLLLFVLALLSGSPRKSTILEPIQMVQPCGWFFCAETDAVYAEHVNLPNSSANLNNSEALLNYESAYVTQAATLGAGAYVGILAALVFAPLLALAILRAMGKI